MVFKIRNEIFAVNEMNSFHFIYGSWSRCPMATVENTWCRWHLLVLVPPAFTTSTSHILPSPLPIPLVSLISTNQLNPDLLPLSPWPIKPRRPHAGCQISQNPLRPHVSAADHLFTWDTPHAACHRQHLIASLPPDLVNSSMMSTHGAYAPNTKTTYATGTLHFTQFFDTWGINEEARMPASYPLLCTFIGEHKGRQARNTIHSWLSGICIWHVINHAPWFGDDKWVQLAQVSANKEGIKHECPCLHWAPVSSSLCSQSFYSFPCSNLGSCLVHIFWVSTTRQTGCYYCHCVWWKISCSSLCYVRYLYSLLYISFLYLCRITFCMLQAGSSSANFHIPWTKMTKELGMSVILTAWNDNLCPVTTLKNHLSINSSMNQSAPLFAYTTASSQSKILLKHEFLSFCTHIWSSTMLAHVLGHSFHIGGAIELLLAGVLPEIVATTGG